MSTEDFLKTFPPEDAFPEEGYPPREPSLPTTRLGRFAATHGLTLRDVFRLFFKHKWAILIPLVISTALGVAYTMVATPWFEATATVQIQPNELAALAPTVNLERQKNLLNDQVQVLRSDTMLERVVEVLRLDTRMASLLGEETASADRVTVRWSCLADSRRLVRLRLHRPVPSGRRHRTLHHRNLTSWHDYLLVHE